MREVSRLVVHQKGRSAIFGSAISCHLDQCYILQRVLGGSGADSNRVLNEHIVRLSAIPVHLRVVP
jgi:hypothetical protein